MGGGGRCGGESEEATTTLVRSQCLPLSACMRVSEHSAMKCVYRYNSDGVCIFGLRGRSHQTGGGDGSGGAGEIGSVRRK